MSDYSAYFLALTAATLFSGASVIFAQYSVSHSSLWMNYIKNLVAGLCFLFAAGLSIFFWGEDILSVTTASLAFLLVSGALGLAIGDFFLFKAYARLGSARTIMIFSFSPLFLSIEGFLFFGQSLSAKQGVALFFMMACAWTLSLERFRSHGTWEWKGILFAVLGVALDNAGVVLSRFAFDQSPALSPFSANAIRCVGAALPLYIGIRLAGVRGMGQLFELPRRQLGLVVFASFMGTFLSLSCWLTALKIGHIGSLAGVGSFNPVAASLWEWLLLRKRPTPLLILALLLFLIGFFTLIY